MSEEGEEPKTPVFRLDALKTWTGFNEDQIRKYVDNDIIKPIRHTGCRNLYSKENIKEQFGL